MIPVAVVRGGRCSNATGKRNTWAAFASRFAARNADYCSLGSMPVGKMRVGETSALWGAMFSKFERRDRSTISCAAASQLYTVPDEWSAQYI